MPVSNARPHFTMVRLSDFEHELLRRCAAELGLTMPDLLRQLLRKHAGEKSTLETGNEKV